MNVKRFRSIAKGRSGGLSICFLAKENDILWLKRPTMDKFLNGDSKYRDVYFTGAWKCNLCSFLGMSMVMHRLTCIRDVDIKDIITNTVHNKSSLQLQDNDQLYYHCSHGRKVL